MQCLYLDETVRRIRGGGAAIPGIIIIGLNLRLPLRAATFPPVTGCFEIGLGASLAEDIERQAGCDRLFLCFKTGMSQLYNYPSIGAPQVIVLWECLPSLQQ